MEWSSMDRRRLCKISKCRLPEWAYDRIGDDWNGSYWSAEGDRIWRSERFNSGFDMLGTDGIQNYTILQRTTPKPEDIDAWWAEPSRMGTLNHSHGNQIQRQLYVSWGLCLTDMGQDTSREIIRRSSRIVKRRHKNSPSGEGYISLFRPVRLSLFRIWISGNLQNSYSTEPTIRWFSNVYRSIWIHWRYNELV